MRNCRFVPRVSGLESRNLLTSVAPALVVGNTLFIRSQPTGNTSVTVAFNGDGTKLDVNYSTHGFAGPYTTYEFNASNINSVTFLGTGSGNYFENDSFLNSTVILTSNSNTVLGPEDDIVILLGSNNHVDAGGTFSGKDYVFRFGTNESIVSYPPDQQVII